jgi:hypothetical protein
MVDVTKAEDIWLSKSGNGIGMFDDYIYWVYVDGPKTFAEAMNRDPATPSIVCDFSFSLRIETGGSKVVPGGQYFYRQHGLGNDGNALGDVPTEARTAHERGHARAYLEDVKPRAEEIHAKWGGRILTDDEQKKVKREYAALKTDVYWAKSGKYANDDERAYMDTSGLFTRTFPSNRKDIGRKVRKVTYNGEVFMANDIWVAK